MQRRQECPGLETGAANTDDRTNNIVRKELLSNRYVDGDSLNGGQYRVATRGTLPPAGMGVTVLRAI